MRVRLSDNSARAHLSVHSSHNTINFCPKLQQLLATEFQTTTPAPGVAIRSRERSELLDSLLDFTQNLCSAFTFDLSQHLVCLGSSTRLWLHFTTQLGYVCPDVLLSTAHTRTKKNQSTTSPMRTNPGNADKFQKQSERFTTRSSR